MADKRILKHPSTKVACSFISAPVGFEVVPEIGVQNKQPRYDHQQIPRVIVSKCRGFAPTKTR
ncbi:hypothetical protein L917_07027 [Phytophthora nicotianae]|uniref:Uncharacterized protein n=1 Tax=Phytophthora nicotianae TaxID=4792 RepID=W2J8K7_PHYNI|nr:hypothetical protein L915_07190 [Phytophthora nicotianae]ETL41968.1 hypothetical protein L916_07138 [Phytophthora nicotianae]ETL95123.1 hypothetical protein L917_07027 [Phytophthora nicotianae]ETM48349.1 hypothetical protein L914_07100 [Phytophthora nicotianae]